MTREELSSWLHDRIGEFMGVETEARRIGETYVADHLEVARSFIVAAAQRIEPPPERVIHERVTDLMPPAEGPPLPKNLGLRWPWQQKTS